MEDPNGTAVISPGGRRLNDLPEEILSYILSFLSTKSAVQTSVLSRKWRNLWCRLCSLYFPYNAFTTITPRSIADFINQTLIHRSSTSPHLHKLYIQFDFKDKLYSTHVDSWIHYAIHHHVQELELDFFISREFQAENSDEDELVYDFPFSWLKYGTVQVLKLTKCRITCPRSIASMALDSLRSVFLDQVELTDETVYNLVSGCGNLKCLSLEYCYGMKDVKIYSLNLKELILNYFSCDDDGSLEIFCPNLESLEMVGFQVEKYNLNNVSRLAEASVAFLHMFKYYSHWSQVARSLFNVKRLTVQNWWFKLLSGKDVSRSLLFRNLKHLELRTEYSKTDLLGIAAILNISPNIEMLILDYLCKIDKDESLPEELLKKPISLSVPSLRTMEIRDYRETENVSMFMSVLIASAAVLEKIVLVPPVVGDSECTVLVLHSPRYQLLMGSP